MLGDGRPTAAGGGRRRGHPDPVHRTRAPPAWWSRSPTHDGYRYNYFHVNNDSPTGHERRRRAGGFRIHPDLQVGTGEGRPGHRLHGRHGQRDRHPAPPLRDPRPRRATRSTRTRACSPPSNASSARVGIGPWSTAFSPIGAQAALAALRRGEAYTVPRPDGAHLGRHHERCGARHRPWRGHRPAARRGLPGGADGSYGTGAKGLPLSLLPPTGGR